MCCEFNQSNTKQDDLLKKILLDSKVIAEELRIQLGVVQMVGNEKKNLSNRLRTVQREASLCKERDDLNMKRNTALVRENRLLRERCEELAGENVGFKKEADECVASMTRLNEDRLQEVQWANEQLGIHLIVKDTKLKISQKMGKNLLERNESMLKVLRGKASTT